MGCHFLLQGIFPTQELNLGLLHCRQILHRLSYQGGPWKDWCWSWSSSSLATWFEELTHWKRPWCWERLKAGGEVDDRGWDGWTASPTRWTWLWASSGSWWWTGKPGMLRSMWLQRAGHDWATELNWRCVVMCISTEQAHIKDTELAVIVLIINSYCHSQCARECLCVLHALSHLTLATALWRKHYRYLHK